MRLFRNAFKMIENSSVFKNIPERSNQNIAQYSTKILSAYCHSIEILCAIWGMVEF